MNWEQELLNLYEINADKVGQVNYRVYRKKGEDLKVPYVLLPPFHTTVTAQIEVEIDEDGKFLDASAVANEDKQTIIPITEKSGSRTAGKAPHPLCDNLQYLAGDYGRYSREKTKGAEECHVLYMNALKEWHESPYTHKKVDAVYAYLKKNTLMKDLAETKVLLLDENGNLDASAKIQNIPQEKAFVRFVVRQKFAKDIVEENCWLDRTLQDAFIRYYQTMEGEKNLDYLTGKQEVPSYLHSKKIRNEGDGAKLISSNDTTNFTFLGRFLTKEQAFSIGGESSQKIHNALKWIIRRQGVSFDTLTMVTWESNLQPMPRWDASTEVLVSSQTSEEEFEEEFDDDFGEDLADEDLAQEKKENVSDGNMITAFQFCSALKGYRKKIENSSRMVLMAFDAATTGRLALAEYKVLETGKYLENIEKWHLQGGWLQQKFKNKKIVRYEGIPGITEIADILYGSDAGGFLTINDKNGKKLYGELSKRLLPCIWNGRKLPYDLVVTAVNRASNPQSYKERFNWERVLMLACSLVKKYRYETSKEEWKLALEKECKDRNYLYGRLLAVADRIEYRTYDMDRDAGRVTNAKRYMSTFAQRPYDTWKIIEENLQPYLNKLKAVERRYYENLIDEICQQFTSESFCDNTKLDGLYLLGFHSQSYDLKTYKKEEE